MSLAKVITGRIVKPIRVCLYGAEGVGKSTFAGDAPAPIFLGAEDGTSELDVTRFPQPNTWEDVLEAVTELTNSQHGYQTLVVDTLDWIEPIAWERVCRGRKTKDGKRIETIEDFGYGKGYNNALDQWRILLSALERLHRARNMHMVLLAHSHIKSFKNPAGEDFDRYQLKLHDKAAGLVKEWTDVVLFAHHETYTHESNGRAKGIQSGARVLQTQRTAAWDAKNRYDLPEKLPLDWNEFFEAVQAHRPADPATLRGRIERLLEQTSDGSLIEKVRASVAKVGDDAAQLARIQSRLTATIVMAEETADNETNEQEQSE